MKVSHPGRRASRAAALSSSPGRSVCGPAVVGCSRARLALVLALGVALGGSGLLAGCADAEASVSEGTEGGRPSVVSDATPAPTPPATSEVSPRMLRRFQPVSATPPDAPPGRVALGRRLFHDARLSADGKVSCATCHDLDRFGVDGLPVSVGVNGVRGRRNAPSVYNLSLIHI